MLLAIPLAILIVVALYLATRGEVRRRGTQLARPRRRDRSHDGMTYVDAGDTHHTGPPSHDSGAHGGSFGGGGASGDWGGDSGGDGGD